MLDVVASYHCMQFQGKRMIQTRGNGKKHHFGLDLGPFAQNSGDQFFFFQKSGLSVTRYPGQLSSCKISKKTHDIILRKFRDRISYGRMDRQTDKSDFIGRCPTDAEGPI